MRTVWELRNGWAWMEPTSKPSKVWKVNETARYGRSKQRQRRWDLLIAAVIAAIILVILEFCLARLNFWMSDVNQFM